MPNGSILFDFQCKRERELAHKKIKHSILEIWIKLQGSTLTVVRLPGASEMRLRASETGTQLVRSGK
jgi:hypothetical protein